MMRYGKSTTGGKVTSTTKKSALERILAINLLTRKTAFKLSVRTQVGIYFIDKAGLVLHLVVSSSKVPVSIFVDTTLNYCFIVLNDAID